MGDGQRQRKIERVTAYDGDIEVEADVDVELIETEVERNL